MAAKDLTQGPIPPLIVTLALPVLASFVLQSAYALGDLYFVGMLGDTAVAALSICLNTFFILLSLGMTIGIGSLALIARAFGAGRHAQVPVLFQQLVWLSLLVGVVAAGAAMALAGPFVGIFTQDAEVHTLAVGFFRVFALTFLVQLIAMSTSFAYRAVGDFITPTALNGLGVTLNLALDPLLMFGWGPIPAMGLTGAAVATVGVQFLGVGILAWLALRRKPGNPLSLRGPLVWDGAIMLRILRVGIPAGLQFLLFAFSLMIIFRLVRPFGPQAAAAVGVGFRLVETGILPVVSIGAAVSALSGQNLGAGRLDRVRAAVSWGLAYGLVLSAVEYALIVWQPEFWMSVFAKDPAVVRMGTQYLWIVGLILPSVAVSHTVSALAQGLGRTGYPLLGQAVRVTGFLCALLVLHVWLDLGLTSIFWSRTLSMLPEIVFMVGVLMYFRRTVLRVSPVARGEPSA